MNRSGKAIVLCLVVLFSVSFSAQADEVTSEPVLEVMTFNIRRNDFFDWDNSWSNRKTAVASMIKRVKPDIIGLQEALYYQVWDLNRISPTLRYVGVGKEDGLRTPESGEYNPIFYNSERLELLVEDTFWLSEAPNMPSIGWDAANRRIATWIKFRDVPTGGEFFVFNTHFDHRGSVAQLESSKLILEKIQGIAGESPVIFMGDMNVIPGSEPYEIIANAKDENGLPMLADSRLVSEEVYIGPEATFSGFNPNSLRDASIKDYIFVSEDFQVESYDILQDTVNSRFISDHRPLLTSVRLR